MSDNQLNELKVLINSRMDGIDGRLDGIDGRLENLEVLVGKGFVDIGDMIENLRNEMYKRDKKFNIRLAKLEYKVNYT